ncbi:hypothetical protein BDR07DRAFT_1381786 [Suillus spraguei]|nr:hypothetical protein BDR07DRAFT_1381786 [Suillus spraguei]
MAYQIISTIHYERLRDSRSVPPLDIESSNETNAAEHPPEGRPRGKICRFLGKVTNAAILFSRTSVKKAHRFQIVIRIFDTVIGKVPEVHPYAKMALSVLSCASKVDRDEAMHNLLEKMDQVYSFMMQDDTLHQISSLSRPLNVPISSEIIRRRIFFWRRLGKNVVTETDDTIQRYNNVLDALMQNFRDQVVRGVAIYIHHTSDILDLSGMAYAEGAGLD